MTRLSRKDRYQDLRQTISDQNGEAKTSAPSAQKMKRPFAWPHRMSKAKAVPKRLR
ncbi:hypothetical protein [Allobaculum sp. Allo2]|uniref:hypothetical protein n=1 Tax=Allobaculum sp. Allo2 TaxID=2853432 RepID=UPI001F61CD83|nr:hypothetical protein [Allobaculum sp. Allo2]UNT92406.1 hypothetical protein KWG61_09480 [Allobaculum sp. Allo2]